MNTMKILIKILFNLTFLLYISSSWANDKPHELNSQVKPISQTILLNKKVERINLINHIDYFLDKSGQFSFNDVIHPQKFKLFKKNIEKKENFGFTDSVYWAKFFVNTKFTSHQDWLIEINYPLMDEIEIYIINKKTNKIQIKKSGRIYPFQQREIKHRNFVFYLNLKNKSNYTIYVKLKTRDILLTPMSIWNQNTFNDLAHEDQFILGLLYGILLIMILYNFSLFVFLKDLTYLFYVLFVLFTALLFISENGSGYEYLWSNFPWFYQFSGAFWGGLSSLLGTFYFKRFFETKKKNPIINSILTINVYFSLSLIILAPFIPVIYSGLWISNQGIFTFIFVTILSIKNLKNGYRPARNFLIGFILFIIAFIIYFLQLMNVIPISIVTTHIPILGLTLMVFLFSLAQADRYNEIKKEKENAQNISLEYLRETNKLKSKILDLTADELEESESRYKLLFDLSPESIMVFTNNKLSVINNAGKKLLNIKNKTEKSCADVFFEKNPSFIPKSMKRIKKQFHEETIINCTNKRIVIEKIILPFRYLNQSSSLVVCRDVSESRRILRLREDTERILRHDLKGPLNGIIGFSDFLLNNDLPEELKQPTLFIQNNAYRILNMIKQSMDLFQMEEGLYKLHLSKFNLIKSIKTLSADFQSLIKAKNVSVEIHPKKYSSRFFMVADKLYIENMMTNLLKNAYESCDENSIITIYLSKNINNKQYIIDIHNFGEIDTVIKKKFFDKYSTSKKFQGVGLGTYSSLLIAKTHGGDIQLNSSKKDGIHVIISIPIKKILDNT